MKGKQRRKNTRSHSRRQPQRCHNGCQHSRLASVVVADVRQLMSGHAFQLPRIKSRQQTACYDDAGPRWIQAYRMDIGGIRLDQVMRNALERETAGE